MNGFMIVISILYVGASGWELWRGQRGMAVVYAAWAVSNIILAFKR